MGGRLSHQRSTRPLVPANFLDRNAPFPPASSQEPQYGAPCGRGQRQPSPLEIYISPKALAPTGGSREILRKSLRRE
jgi:hypothetical protein